MELSTDIVAQQITDLILFIAFSILDALDKEDICYRVINRIHFLSKVTTRLIKVTFLYPQLFKHLEDIRLLDMTSETDLLCLYYVFFPRIKSYSKQFRLQWKSHP